MKLIHAVTTSLAALTVTSCGTLALTAANAPAWFGDFERRADIAYGALPRQGLDVYIPAGAGPHPVIVFWYGGAWQRGHKAQFRFVGAALAKAGYVAVLPDYRIHPQVKFPDFVHDGAAALAWTRSHLAEIRGDARRLYVGGHSAGAHLAAMLAYDPGQLARVNLPRETIRGFIGLSGPYALTPNEPVYHRIFGAPFTAAQWQPARLVAAGAPPALLLHGADDDVVAVDHARAMARALEAAGVAVELEIYEGRGHPDTVAAFALPAPKKLPVLEAIRRFVDVKGREREAA